MKTSKRSNAMEQVRSARAKTQVAAYSCREPTETQAAATAAMAMQATARAAATPNIWADACFVAAMGPNVLSIGSDCSGWCTELQAARAVCPFPVRQVFACDSAAYVRRPIHHCIKPTCLFDDLRARSFDHTQHLDIYVAGWPCQASSKE